MSEEPATFDSAAAVTRSLLGWGVVAGPFYVVVGLTLALTRPRFDLQEHPLSLLMLGEHGWMQRVNFVVAAVMVLAAAVGVLRTIRDGRGLAVGVLTCCYGVCLILSSIFAPDPVDGFPAGNVDETASTSGVLHIVLGALGFVSLAAAAFAYARWAAERHEAAQVRIGVICGAVLLVGFIAGAALAESVAGVALLWLAVLAGWAWLALASAHLYGVVPHPVIAQRSA